VVTQNLISALKQLNVTHYKIKGNQITVFLEGRALPRHKIKIMEHVPQVGSWGKTKAFVKLDNDIKKRHWNISLTIHEIIERLLMRKKSRADDWHWELPYNIAHNIADHIERKFHIRKWGLKSWQEYGRRVEEVYAKERVC